MGGGRGMGAVAVWEWAAVAVGWWTRMGMGGSRGMDMSVAEHATIEQAGRKTTIAKVDPDLCTGCGVCVDMCPMGAISLRDNTAQVDVQKCTGCGICEDECPVGAISLQ